MSHNNISQMEIDEASSKKIYFSVIESILYVSGEPLSLKEIAGIIECSLDYTKAILEELSMQYKKEERGIELISINDAYQLVTKPQNSIFIQKLLKTNVRQSLSQAALETLSIIAYKQPITRVSIDEIRGVKSDRAILTLLDKNLIKEAGRMEVPGRPILYATTEEFLRHFGLEKLHKLPSIDELINNIYDDIQDEEAFNEAAADKENED